MRVLLIRFENEGDIARYPFTNQQKFKVEKIKNNIIFTELNINTGTISQLNRKMQKLPTTPTKRKSEPTDEETQLKRQKTSNIPESRIIRNEEQYRATYSVSRLSFPSALSHLSI
jgi:hypothetical protein